MGIDHPVMAQPKLLRSVGAAQTVAQRAREILVGGGLVNPVGVEERNVVVGADGVVDFY
jgi:hypothetical protein